MFKKQIDLLYYKTYAFKKEYPLKIGFGNIELLNSSY